jgi:hypothetical protein
VRVRPVTRDEHQTVYLALCRAKELAGELSDQNLMHKAGGIVWNALHARSVLYFVRNDKHCPDGGISWSVGEVGKLRTFTHDNTMLLEIHQLIAVPGAIRMHQLLTTATNPAEGARSRLKTALAILRPYCPELADALKRGLNLKRGALRFDPARAQADILLRK